MGEEPTTFIEQQLNEVMERYDDLFDEAEEIREERDRLRAENIRLTAKNDSYLAALLEMEFLREENARLAAELAAARERITQLENWVRKEGDRGNTCTYDILNKEVCNGCLCGRLTE